MEAFNPAWLLPDDPLRPLDWRWRSARYLAPPRRGRPPNWRRSLQSDPWIASAVEYVRAGCEPASRNDRSSLMAQALQLALHRSSRWRIEARLLAGQEL